MSEFERYFKHHCGIMEDLRLIHSFEKIFKSSD